jgi:hypothetical protein
MDSRHLSLISNKVRIDFVSVQYYSLGKRKNLTFISVLTHK